MLHTHRNLLRTQEKGRFVFAIWTVVYVVDKLLETDACQFFFLNNWRERIYINSRFRRSMYLNSFW